MTILMQYFCSGKFGFTSSRSNSGLKSSLLLFDDDGNKVVCFVDSVVGSLVGFSSSSSNSGLKSSPLWIVIGGGVSTGKSIESKDMSDCMGGCVVSKEGILLMLHQILCLSPVRLGSAISAVVPPSP
mmetsp:Transcript_6256/g.8182  ORF Transcript_6256/g.8182 Transcript_6256/m.8182 type:complete len:127 (+) Transcript_6256:1915-2295(+)